MGAGSKTLALTIILFMVLPSLVVLTAKPTNAQTIPKPSVPEFTIQYVAHPYDVPATYTIDPYTGETITHPGYHVENKSRVLVIKNQPLPPDLSNGEVTVYYQVRYKGHYSDNEWYEVYHLPDYPVQSDSEYTTISPKLNIQSKSASTDGAKIDFQVQALIGSIYLVEARLYGGANYWTFDGEKSDWSCTQTITVNLTTPTPSPSSPTPTTPSTSQNPSSTPQQRVVETSVLFGLDWEQTIIAALGIAVVVLAVATVLLLYTRNRKTKQHLDNLGI
jgi:hypothetical protein